MFAATDEANYGETKPLKNTTMKGQTTTMSDFVTTTRMDEKAAVNYAQRTLGDQWRAVLAVSDKIATGWRIPEITNLDQVKQQLRDRVSVTDYEQSEVLSEVIVAEWKNAAGKRTGVAQAMKTRKMLEELQAGNTSAKAGFQSLIADGMRKNHTLVMNDPEITELGKKVQTLQKELEAATTDYGRTQIEGDLNKAMEKYNTAVMTKLAEAQRPRESFRLAAQIVALGPDYVDPKVYNLVTGN